MRFDLMRFHSIRFTSPRCLPCSLQAAAVLPLVFFSYTRQNPFRVVSHFSKALLTAFGTDSSTAALPVTMECARALKCNDSIVKFVLPLGATVNMNGTALYEATTVLFIAQARKGGREGEKKGCIYIYIYI